MRVIVRDAAYADLVHIRKWIHKERPASAVAVIEQIFDSIERLALFPYMGHKGKVAGTLEWVVPGLPYVVVYQVDKKQRELHVIAVFHCAQDR